MTWTASYGRGDVPMEYQDEWPFLSAWEGCRWRESWDTRAGAGAWRSLEEQGDTKQHNWRQRPWGTEWEEGENRERQLGHKRAFGVIVTTKSHITLLGVGCILKYFWNWHSLWGLMDKAEGDSKSRNAFIPCEKFVWRFFIDKHVISEFFCTLFFKNLSLHNL